MYNYLSIKKPVMDEIEIKKSRFITYLYPIREESDFDEYLAQIRKEHYKATHHCQAYILGDDSMIQRMSDDGEPSGTAGIPMLEVLKRQELTYIMAVTVRYFGGTKLGAGGLIRAYSSAVSEALNHAQIMANVDQILLEMVLEYASVDSFNYYLQETDYQITILDTQYTDKVTYQLAVYTQDADAIQEALTNRFSGQVQWKELGEQTIDIPFNKPEE